MTGDRDGDLPAFDGRPTIRLDHGMPEKESVVNLSDSAFRLFVEAICYCGRNETDGSIPKAILRRTASKPAAIRELQQADHIVELDATTWTLPDYLRFNRAKLEIDSIRSSKAESGVKGAHMRWHVPRRQRVADCPYCLGEVADSA